MTKVHAKCVDFIDYSFGFKSEKSVYKEIEGKVHFIESKTNLKIAIFNKITNEIVDCFYCLNKDKLKNRFIGIIYFDLKAKDWSDVIVTSYSELPKKTTSRMRVYSKDNGNTWKDCYSSVSSYSDSCPIK